MPYNPSYYWQGGASNRRYQDSAYPPHHQNSSGHGGSYDDGRNPNQNPNSQNPNPSGSSAYGYRRDFHDRPPSNYYRGRPGFKRNRSSQYDRYNPNDRYRPAEKREDDDRADDRRNKQKQAVRPAFELNSLQDPHTNDDSQHERRDSKSSVSSKSSIESRADDSTFNGIQSSGKEAGYEKSSLSKTNTRDSETETHQAPAQSTSKTPEMASDREPVSKSSINNQPSEELQIHEKPASLKTTSVTPPSPNVKEEDQTPEEESYSATANAQTETPQDDAAQGLSLHSDTKIQTQTIETDSATSPHKPSPTNTPDTTVDQPTSMELKQSNSPPAESSISNFGKSSYTQPQPASTAERQMLEKRRENAEDAENAIAIASQQNSVRPLGTPDSSTLTSISAGSKDEPEMVKLEALVENEGNDYEEELSEAETVISETKPTTENANILMKQLAIKEASADNSEGSSDYSDSSESETKNAVVPPKRRSKKRPYVIKRDASGSSLLQRACKKGNLDEVEELISRGADPNECDFCGFTCLHEASLAGHTEVVKYLIEKGADVNKQSFQAGDLETPLIDAADNKHLDIVKILLDNGANPRIFNSDGFNALTKIHNQHGDEEGYDEIIRLLEEASNRFSSMEASNNDSHTGERRKSVSPDVIIEDPNDAYFAELLKKKNSAASVYKYAAEGVKDITAAYLLEGGRLEYKPDILILAARNGHAELVDIILGVSEDYDINSENKCGLTPLLASVGRGHLDVVKFLLDKGANPFMRRKPDNLNALEIAERSPNFDPNEVDIIESYMKKNANYSLLTQSPGTTEASEPPKVFKKAGQEKPAEHKRKSLSVETQDERKPKKPRTKNNDSTARPIKKETDSDKTPIQKNTSHPDMVVDEAKEEESGIVPQASSVFAKAKTPDTEHQYKSNDTTASPTRSKHSMSPSPQPLTKAQEELKAKNAKEAKIWQEKNEAKKKARRVQFLKSEKEKERRRKEEELKRIEEERKLQTLRREQEAKKLKELEEETRRVEQEKERLGIELIMDSYPVGLRYAKFGVPVPKEDILKFSPVYMFVIEGATYVTDLQISLITGEAVTSILNAVPAEFSREATWEDKAKLWKLFFPIIGTHGTTRDFVELINSGYEKFRFLQINFVKLEDVASFVQLKFPKTYQVVWGSSRFIKVDLASLGEFSKVQDVVTEEPKDELNIDSLPSFVPPKLKNRIDVLKAIHTSKTPMW